MIVQSVTWMEYSSRCVAPRLLFINPMLTGHHLLFLSWIIRYGWNTHPLGIWSSRGNLLFLWRIAVSIIATTPTIGLLRVLAIHGRYVPSLPAYHRLPCTSEQVPYARHTSAGIYTRYSQIHSISSRMYHLSRVSHHAISWHSPLLCGFLPSIFEPPLRILAITCRISIWTWSNSVGSGLCLCRVRVGSWMGRLAEPILQIRGGCLILLCICGYVFYSINSGEGWHSRVRRCYGIVLAGCRDLE